MASRKDYEVIAGVLNKQGETITKAVLLSELADAFEKDNPNFDRDKFFKACYGGK